MSKQLRLLTVYSIAFVMLLFVSSLAGCSFAKNGLETIPVKSEVKTGSKVIVYYFYTNKRCASCHKIESYTKEAVQGIKNNKVEFRMVNIDESAHKHFVKDYGLYTKSVVVSNVKNGKQVNWKNLDKIWTLLGDKSKFENYILKEVKSYL